MLLLANQTRYNNRMKFVLDTCGNDLGPSAVVKGAVSALKKTSDLDLVLVGNEEELLKLLAENKADMTHFEIVDAKEVFTNDEKPTDILKNHEETTLYKALIVLKDDNNIDAMISGGSTGAILTGGMLRIGRIPGVLRPCLMATIPARTGQLVRILDIGANMDSKPEYLHQYALMVNEYLKLEGNPNPRIGLLNVGKEEEKGNALTHEVFELLRNDKRLNFVGNIEADHVVEGEADAVICDAFAGNVFIKSLEGASYFVSDAFQAAIKKNIFTKFGALFQLHELKKIKKLFKLANNASAPLLGVKKLIVKMHGKSKPENVEAIILGTVNLAKGGLTEKIQDVIKLEE